MGQCFSAGEWFWTFSRNHCLGWDRGLPTIIPGPWISWRVGTPGSMQAGGGQEQVLLLVLPSPSPAGLTRSTGPKQCSCKPGPASSEEHSPSGKRCIPPPPSPSFFKVLGLVLIDGWETEWRKGAWGLGTHISSPGDASPEVSARVLPHSGPGAWSTETPSPPAVAAAPLRALISQRVAVTLIAVYVVPVTPAALGPKLSALCLPRRTDGPAAERRCLPEKAQHGSPGPPAAAAGLGRMGWGGGAAEPGSQQGPSHSAPEKAAQRLRPRLRRWTGIFTAWSDEKARNKPFRAWWSCCLNYCFNIEILQHYQWCIGLHWSWDNYLGFFNCCCNSNFFLNFFIADPNLQFSARTPLVRRSKLLGLMNVLPASHSSYLILGKNK